MSRAFTLPELLAVVAVGGVLTSMTFGGIKSATDSANAARCVGNLRQWGVALQAYVQDSGGYLPRRGQGVQQVWIVDRPEDWFNALTPYLEMPSYAELVAQGRPPKAKERSVFVCPAAGPAQGAKHFITYGMNMYLSRWDQPERTRIVSVRDPSALAFLADSPGGYASTVPSRSAYSVSPRHAGSANVLFLDGHVSAFRGDYLGCGSGEKTQPDVRWRTGAEGDTWRPGG